MNINDTSELLNTLLSQADKKSEKKLYTCFIRTLTSLKNKDLTQSQLELIQEKLSSLNLKTTTENRKKFYKQKHSEFKEFLKNEFSFTSEKHYTELWMIYGMIIRTVFGFIFGGIGISFGISIDPGAGLIFGMLYGSTKDAEAKKQGKVI